MGPIRHPPSAIRHRIIAGIFRGERPPRLVNPEAWAKFVQRFEKVFGFRPKAE